MLFQETIVSFTGHRPDEFPGHYDHASPARELVKKRIREELLRLKPQLALVGMALGVDQWAAEVCLELDIPFVAVVPFVGMETVWPQKAQEHFRELLFKATKTVIVCKGGYSPDKMQRRNEALVDGCTVMIAVWNGKPTGGTANCVQYAQKVGRPILRINPVELFDSKVHDGSGVDPEE